jgi:hypothetical protein
MPELSLQNIDQISRDVRNQEITFSHLLEDLIDHVCCDVENEMHNGLSFPEAYRRVKQKMGSRRLKEIQEETLYAVDIKYRQMKNTMKISGITGTVLLGFASLFKIMHWPGAGIMMTIGAFTLAFMFMPSALGVLWKETHSARRLFLFISAFFAGMFFIMGILFKVQHWPGAGIIVSLAALSGILLFIPSLLVNSLSDPEKKAKRPAYVFGAIGLIFYTSGLLCKIQHWPLAGILMVSGMIILFVIAFPWYTFITWKEDSHVKPQFIFIMVGSLALIIPSAMVTLNLQRSYDKGYYVNYEQEKAVYNYMYSHNRACIAQYHDSSFYPVMEQLNSRTNELLKLINTIELKMVSESEGKPGNPAENPPQVFQTENGQEIKVEFLSKPFHPLPVNDFLLPGTASRTEIEKGMRGYRNFLSAIIPAGQLQYLNQMLDPSTYLPSKNPDGRKVSLLAGLHSMELLKNSLLAVESYSLGSIAKH